MKCACGLPLHYTDEKIEAAVNQLVAQLGEYITVTAEDKSYSVQRHFIALHGLKAAELPLLLAKGIVKRGT